MVKVRLATFGVVFILQTEFTKESLVLLEWKLGFRQNISVQTYISGVTKNVTKLSLKHCKQESKLSHQFYRFLVGLI